MRDGTSDHKTPHAQGQLGLTPRLIPKVGTKDNCKIVTEEFVKSYPSIQCNCSRDGGTKQICNFADRQT